MSRSDKSRKPRYTGYGRPVYHDHGSRRALLEQQDSRSAIKEYEEEPLADWERELLASADEHYASEPYEPPARRNPFAPTMPPTMGFIPGTQRMPSQAERDDMAARRAERAAVQARQNAWIASTNVRRAQEEREARIFALAGPKDPARRYHVTPQHRVRVAELSATLGLTNVQTIYLLNTICKEYAKSGNSMIASIVASDLEKMVTDREGGGRALVRTILVDNQMGDIDEHGAR